MDEGTTDRRVRSHPPQCTTSRDDKQIVRMAVTDRSVTSRSVAQHIQLHLQLPHQISFGNVWKLLGLLYPKNTSKVSLNQCRGLWQQLAAVISNNGSYSGY
ncbi:hypothetical protein LAZ67_5002891 [Cordylochernes scorpioides]|uniref:Uncharacterized protein n=1 Tax=Cordylochernes scorpioides TaxID=51811 RepID=A0ABY6KLK5_9ARAC|nr:hypothetical protein LAZ67_5002891 [Cordylochernes scorpioides]